ncbi:MAG: hypothetical protein K0S12_2172, partial [Bacteroidetes bacterium]|nr:hypothetical protein [Bacteroidota bacterium]
VDVFFIFVFSVKMRKDCFFQNPQKVVKLIPPLLNFERMVRKEL